MRPRIDATMEFSTNAPGIHDPILYNSVVNPTPYPARTMPDIHKGAFSPLYRLMLQHKIRYELRKVDKFNPYINQMDSREEAKNYKNHVILHPLRALFG